MLTPKKPVESIELNQDKNCLIVDIDACDLYAHVHRKGAKHYEDTCFDDSHCGKKKELHIESNYPEEMLSSHGQGPHSFCIPNHIFCSAPGVWVIDIYLEMEVLKECCDQIDPTNFYRPLRSKQMGRKLCKQYEFHIGDKCESSVTTTA